MTRELSVPPFHGASIVIRQLASQTCMINPQSYNDICIYWLISDNLYVYCIIYCIRSSVKATCGLLHTFYRYYHIIIHDPYQPWTYRHQMIFAYHDYFQKKLIKRQFTEFRFLLTISQCWTKNNERYKACNNESTCYWWGW